MTPERFIWPLCGFTLGLALSGITLLAGFPFPLIVWGMPPVGLAAGLFWVRLSIVGEVGRVVMDIVISLCLGAAAIVGFATLISVVTGAWQRSSGTSTTSIARFTGYMAAVWENAWLAIILCVMFAIISLLAGILNIRPYLISLFRGSRDVEGGPWSARWMQPADIRYLARQDAGLPLGRVNGKILRYAPGDGWRGGHHMLVAGTRAGKGVSGVLPAIIDHDGSVVALDIKGELFAVTRRAREEMGRRVVVLNPLGVVEPGRACFNPIDYVRNDPAHIGRDAEVIADGLVKPEAGGTDHFTVMARNLVAAAVEVVVKVAEPEHRNLATLADMLGSDVEATLGTWRDNPDVVGKSPAHTASAVLAAGDKERGSILTTVSKALRWTLSDPMQHFLQRSDFDLEKLMDGDTDLFLVVPLDQLQSLSVFLRLTVNIIAGVAIRNMAHRNSAKSVLLVLDEFTRLGRMQKLLDIATVAAGAGVEALFVTQDRTQITSVYPHGEADTLLGACATVRVFGLGRTDTATAEWIVSGVGDRTVQTRSRQLEGRKKGSGSEQRTKLFTADQLLELPGDEMIGLFPGRPPLRLKRIISHKDCAYKKLLGHNPTL